MTIKRRIPQLKIEDPAVLTDPKTHFSAELFSDTRLRQGVPASVLVYVEDCSAAVKRSKWEKKPLKSPRGRNKKIRNKANLNSAKSTLTREMNGAYNDLLPKTQNGTKPNKANFVNVCRGCGVCR